MWNDNETNIDLIDLTHLVNAVKRIIDNDKLIPCTVGIFGDWGSGKSSLLKMVETSYGGIEGVLALKFNGWLFEGYEDAKSVLMGTILENIIKSRTLSEKAKDVAIRLLKRVDWFKVARSTIKYGFSLATLGPLGVGIASLSDIPKAIENFEYEKFIKNEKESLRMSIQEFHKDFAELLNQMDIKKLIIFIDDLDRCNPDTVIETLEAIKLFLYVERTVFIITADERLIEYCVSKKFPELSGNKLSVSRDYLEKLIQHPIRIPQLSSSEIETYINLLLTFLHLDYDIAEKVRLKVLQEKITSLASSTFVFNNCNSYISDIDNQPELKNDLFLSSQITPILSKGLNGNPRQCKRFLNMLMMRFRIAEDKKMDVEKRILSKIMLLEYFKPESFKSLFEMQSKQNGIPEEIHELEQALISQADKKKSEKIGINASIILSTWLKDEWLKDWFVMEPYLTDVDLRPYFYLTRDRLSIDISIASRMSSATQELFSKLSSQSDSERQNALEQVKNINPNDAISIFNELIKRISESENTDKRDRFIQSLNLLCAERKELLSELLNFYNKFPEEHLSLSIIPQLRNAVKKTEFEETLNKLFTKWTKGSKNPLLAKALKVKKE